MSKTASEIAIEAMAPINLTVPIKPQMLWDQLTSAFEGGSNYWIKSVKIVAEPTSKRTYLQDVPFLGGSLKVTLANPEDVADVKLVTLETLMAGAALMAIKYPHHFKHVVAEDGDAYTGDALLQLAILGDIVYG